MSDHELDPHRPNGPRYSPVVWLATGLGVGLVMPAPGTFGTFIGFLLIWAYGFMPGGAIGWWAAAVAMLAIGVPLCDRAARELNRKDPGPVVWDEFATLPLVFALVPLNSLAIGVLGFLLHRAFDTTKPWPCYLIERLPGGWGIMLDDVVAAIYAAATLGLIWWAKGMLTG